MSTENIKRTVCDKWKFLFLAAYFVILTTERVISLVKCFFGDVKRFSYLDYYMIMLTIFAMFGAYVFAVVRCMVLMKHRNEGDSIFTELGVAAGILLLGGMVHTKGSIPVMQFVSYGMILISMAIHTAQNVRKTKNPRKKWLSFAYIVAYSMAIPVVYPTNLEIANIFVPIECVVSAGMVAIFTIMLVRFYGGNGESGFTVLPFAAAVIGDIAVLTLRWSEEVNVFVLIFLCVMSALWITGNVMFRRKSDR